MNTVRNTYTYRSRTSGSGGFVILAAGETSPSGVNISTIIPQGGDAVISTTNLEGKERGAIDVVDNKTISYPVVGHFGPVTCNAGEVWAYFD